jgi:hypothetical protein
MRVLSLGAGVQSTTLALLAAEGEIAAPDFAVFADTQWEPPWVYEHLQWLMSPNVLPFPVYITTAGNIRESVRWRRTTLGGRYASIPWHTVNEDGSYGMGRRQCSNEYKLEAINREIRRRIDKPGRAYIRPGAVDVMLGISVDEIIRMRPSKAKWMNNVFPLIDLGMRRHDCLLWLKRHGYPEPRKSSCLGCPYHRDPRYWRDLRDNHPALWADCVQADREIRMPSHAPTQDLRATAYMHWQRVPLDEVDLSIDDRQGELLLGGEFGEECSGMCSV